MYKIFLSTHSQMAGGMKASIDLLLGDSSCITAYDAYLPEDSTTVEQHIDAFLASLAPGEAALLVSDIPAGSVNQVMMRYLNRENVFVVTGVNLGLLQLLCLSCDEDLTAESLDEMVAEGRELTRRVVLEETSGGGDFF